MFRVGYWGDQIYETLVVGNTATFLELSLEAKMNIVWNKWLKLNWTEINDFKSKDS